MTTAYMFHQCSVPEYATSALKTRSSAAAKIAQVWGHYAIQGHDFGTRIGSPYATSCYWIIL